MSLIQKLCLFILPLTLLGCTDTDKQPDATGTATNTAVESAAKEVEPATFPPMVPDDKRGFETPEAAYQALSDAEKVKDFKGTIDTYTVDSQKVLSGQMIFSVGMAAAFDESQKDNVTAFFARHGLDEHSMQKPPPGITAESTQVERMRAIGDFLPNAAVFVVEAFEFLESMPNVNSNQNKDTQELTDVTIDGDSAVATIRHRRGRKSMAFRRTTAGWLIHITDAQLISSNGTTTSGSGKPSRFKMSGREEPEQLPPVAEITTDEVQNSWKVSVDYQAQPAIAALEDITQKCGLEIYKEPKPVDALKDNVTVKLDGVSPLEVIEEICSQVNLHPRYKAGKMALTEGPRSLPVAFAGPFIIEATKTHEHIPNAFARIDFQCFAAGLPAATTSKLVGLYTSSEEAPDKITLQLPSLKGIDGTNLSSVQRGFFPAKASKSSVQVGVIVDAFHLLRAVTHIAEFDGSVSWSFPVKLKTATVETLEKGNVTELGDAKMTIDQVDIQDQRSTVKFLLDGVTHKELLINAFDENGKAIEKRRTHLSGSSYNGNTTALFGSQGKVASLKITMALESDRITFPFHFPAIPLAYHQDMPEVLEPVEFEGEEPISFEFVEVTNENNFQQLKLRWTNHTNKDVHAVETKIEYLDAAGEVLKEKDSPLSGNHIMLKFGESRETTALGNSPPEGTVSARVTLKSIEFADTTTWSAAAND